MTLVMKKLLVLAEGCQLLDPWGFRLDEVGLQFGLVHLVKLVFRLGYLAYL